MNEPKRRGRPAGSKTQEQVEQSRVAVEVNRDEQAHGAKRPPRVRMVAGQKLNVSRKDPNYEYRWFNDTPGRLDAALAAYWDFCLEDGEKTKRHAGEKTMYLMRIEKQYYTEDQQLKQKNIVDTMRKENELGSDEYIPDNRHHALQKDDYDPLA